MEETLLPTSERRRSVCSNPGNLIQLILLAVWFSVVILIISQHKTAGPYGAESLVTSRKWTTLPIAATDVGGVVLSLPVTLIARTYGWRFTFMCAGIVGAVSSGLCALALKFKILPLYLAASFCLAALNVAGYFIRFAAAESINATNKAKIISVVLVGSAVTGSFGPQLVGLGKSLGPRYSGVYLVMAGLSGFNAVLSLALRSSARSSEPTTAAAVATNEIKDNSSTDNDDGDNRDGVNVIGTQKSRFSLGQTLCFFPRVAAGMCCSASAMYSMLIVMSATPGAMNGDRYAFGLTATTTTMQLHIVSMFLPGLISGDLMARMGRPAAIGVGLLATYSAITVGFLRTDLPGFVACLVLIGIGWNFTYIGGTKLLIDGYVQAGSSASQVKKLQGINESVAQAAAAVGALLAGVVLDSGNGHWKYVMWATVPSVVLASFAIAVLVLSEQCRRRPVDARPLLTTAEDR